LSENSLLGLIDCNNFYVSCERLFQPKLEGQAVVVLSSNDGCVIARSQEAKALGIPMGAPAFELRECFLKEKVEVLSSNFALYGDLSQRVVSVIEEFGYPVEVYDLPFERERFIRGLVIDKNAGDILKINRFGRIRKSYHGTREIDFRTQSKRHWSTYVDLNDANYLAMDTAFSVTVVSLAALLVDLHDARPSAGLPPYPTGGYHLSPVPCPLSLGAWCLLLSACCLPLPSG